MTTSTSLVTTQQSHALDDFSDIFSDLEPIAPFDLKKDYLAAQMAALLAYSGKSRADLVEELGWKKSRVSSVFSGKCNLTIKSIWEFSTFLGFDFDVVFRSSGELPLNQPWQIKEIEVIPMNMKPVGDFIKIQSAREVAHDFLTGNQNAIYVSVVPCQLTKSDHSTPYNLLKENVVSMNSIVEFRDLLTCT
jgi:transcriptional regulator with XRE-family HTH domain